MSLSRISPRRSCHFLRRSISVEDPSRTGSTSSKYRSLLHIFRNKCNSLTFPGSLSTNGRRSCKSPFSSKATLSNLFRSLLSRMRLASSFGLRPLILSATFLEETSSAFLLFLIRVNVDLCDFSSMYPDSFAWIISRSLSSVLILKSFLQRSRYFETCPLRRTLDRSFEVASSLLIAVRTSRIFSSEADLRYDSILLSNLLISLSNFF